MPDDLVDTLRRNHLYISTSRINSFGMPQMGFELTSFNLIAADEIERLRAVLQGWEHSARNAERDIAELREERDGARAEVCLLRTGTSAVTDTVTQSMADYAESRGWKDLFREDA